MPQTIRIKPETREKLELISRAESMTMTKMLDKLVNAYRREKLLAETNAAFTELKANPKAWEQERKERAQWDTALADGLKDDTDDR